MNHVKILEGAAKTALLPLGLKRQGKSRLWYDDHGWWAIAVEFQPSSWSRGSYLNVGVSWLLYEGENWTFDIGYREKEFRPADDDLLFENAANDLATQAARRVAQYREQFSSLGLMTAHYGGNSNGPAAAGNITKLVGWPKYHAGILAGLAGDRDTATKLFTAVIEEPAKFAWHRSLQFRCGDLLRLLPNPTHFRESVLGIVLRCRVLRKMEEMPVDEIALP